MKLKRRCVASNRATARKACTRFSKNGRRASPVIDFRRCTRYVMKLQDRLAVITGGGRGIGKAIAISFAREGASVALAARTKNEVDAVAHAIENDHQVKALSLVCDVSNSSAVANAFAEISEHFGRGADILVNNAGIALSAPLVKTDDELWQKHLAINLSGSFYCTRAALPHMLEQGWGRIINIASIAAKSGAAYIAAYSASKHGVLGLTQSVAHEVATRGVTVNAICPGYVDTDMTTRGVENITARTGKSPEESLE